MDIYTLLFSTMDRHELAKAIPAQHVTYVLLNISSQLVDWVMKPYMRAGSRYKRTI